jgi:hypothetical protein
MLHFTSHQHVHDLPVHSSACYSNYRRGVFVLRLRTRAPGACRIYSARVFNSRVLHPVHYGPTCYVSFIMIDLDSWKNVWLEIFLRIRSSADAEFMTIHRAPLKRAEMSANVCKSYRWVGNMAELRGRLRLNDLRRMRRVHIRHIQIKW